MGAFKKMISKFLREALTSSEIILFTYTKKIKERKTKQNTWIQDSS